MQILSMFLEVSKMVNNTNNTFWTVEARESSPPQKKGAQYLEIFKKYLDTHPLNVHLDTGNVSFLPMPASIVVLVFRWTFSSPPSPSPSHLLHFRQLQAVQFLFGELSTPVRRTVHRLQAVQWLLFLFSKIQPWARYKTGSDLAHK